MPQTGRLEWIGIRPGKKEALTELKSLRIEQIGARRPVAILIAKRALEHQDLLAIGVRVSVKCRAWIVSNDGSDHPGFRRAT